MPGIPFYSLMWFVIVQFYIFLLLPSRSSYLRFDLGYSCMSYLSEIFKLKFERIFAASLRSTLGLEARPSPDP